MTTKEERAALLEDAEFLLENGEHPSRLSARLNVSLFALAKILRREGRPVDAIEQEVTYRRRHGLSQGKRVEPENLIGDVEVRRPLADGTWWTTWCRLCAAPTGAPTSTRGVACSQAKTHLRGKNHQAKMGTRS